MELELGLAPPNQTAPVFVKGLDLNSCSSGMEMAKWKNGGCNINIHRNPRFGDHGDNDEEVESKGLSLLLWSGQPNEDDEKRRNLHVDEENNDEENQELVGWPPINSLRKELLHRHQGGGGWMAYNHRVAAAAAADHRVVFPVRSTMYVKVKMQGVPIGRKIDVRVHNSYQALTETLINMFAKYTKNDSRDGDYAILYQDKEGDWLLAGDVPWETFVESVQRMKILRNAN